LHFFIVFAYLKKIHTTRNDIISIIETRITT